MHDHTISNNIIHVGKGLWKLPTCPSLVNDPNMQELDDSRARANDLQKAQEEQLAEITRISKELESLKPLEQYCVVSALWTDCFWTVLFSRAPTQTHAYQCQTESTLERLTCWFFTVWWWCVVSLLQEYDEYSEVARMRALEEKYKAEISQLGKDS